MQGVDPDPTTLTTTDAMTLLIPAAPICDTSDPSCDGLCPQYGTTCDIARTFNLDDAAGALLPPYPTPVQCVHGICM